jgi:predicted O-methyltransferase YrrM/SAM-dependent methyltransferase
MGTSISEIYNVLTAVDHSSDKSLRILDIGTQNVYLCTAEEVIRFVRYFNDVWEPDDLAAYAEVVAAGSALHPQWGGVNGAWLGDILSRAGIDYVAYDIFEGYRTTVFDLNSGDMPRADCGSFDVVLNCGTSEHVLNQYNTLKIMHDAARVGGLIYHAVPMTGYLKHGYFNYSPMLFCDLARVNRYEIVKMNFVGPQATGIVSEHLVDGYQIRVPFDESDPITPRWQQVPVPDGIVSVLLRRTTREGFRASLEARTAAHPVASAVLGAYDHREAPAPDHDAGVTTAAKRAAVDRWVESILARFTDPDLEHSEIVRLFEAHREAYDGIPFPPLLEKKGLDLALAAYPQREDLTARLRHVETLLEERWPLLGVGYDRAVVDEQAIAMDGIEAELSSISCRRTRFDHAVAAFHRYLAAGRPEQYPPALELDALRYAAEELCPDDWSLRTRLGSCAGKISNSMTLRRKAPAVPQVNTIDAGPMQASGENGEARAEEWKIDVRPLRQIVEGGEFPTEPPVTMESINLLLSSAPYRDVIRPFFMDYPKMSLMGHDCRAFIYGLVRLSKPELVAEIGTYFAGTAEVFARALWENGRGMLYTTDPYGAERGPAIIRQWPAPLQEVVRFFPEDSMTFLGNLSRAEALLDIILIDGNHEYEFASFDLAVAARMMRPGGIIIMDNVEQSGPFEAARQFLVENPEWRELGNCIAGFELSDPFAMPRCSIPGTSFLVLQAPFSFTVGPKLRSWGNRPAPSRTQFPGFVLELSPQHCRGRLHFQAVYRGFSGDGRALEELKQQGSITIELDGSARTVEHQYDQTLVSDVFVRLSPHCYHNFELELLWQADPGSGPLTLAAEPRPKWRRHNDGDDERDLTELDGARLIH